MKKEKIKCEIGRKKTTTKLWIIALLAIVIMVTLDILLIPSAYVGITSVVFGSAVSIILILILRDVNKSCDF